MRLSSWIDVALEGGALKLQRSAVEYRALRRLFERGWRPHALEVATRCRRLAQDEGAVDAALARAHRRLRQDRDAAELSTLIAAVERERARLRTTAGQTFLQPEGAPVPEGLAVVLTTIEPTVREEAFLESAWIRFQFERRAFTLLVLAIALGVPFLSWWQASAGGVVPTLLSPLAVLKSPAALLATLGAILGVVGGRLRRSQWEWLEPRRAGWLTWAATALGAALSAFVGGRAEPLHPLSAGLVSGVVGAIVGAAFGLVLSAWLPGTGGLSGGESPARRP